MGFPLRILLVLGSFLLCVCEAGALERSTVQLESGIAAPRGTRGCDDESRTVVGDRNDIWESSGTCTIAYYNVCTGWIWRVGGFEPFDRLGVLVDTCCPDTDTSSLTTSWHYFLEGAPCGYSYTGAMTVSAADENGCPVGSPIASQPFLPVDAWNMFQWSADVPSTFVLHMSFGTTPQNPAVVAVDHPAAVNGGVQPCGTCYPSTRLNRSFRYGPAAACPGEVVLNDGVCDAQLLWDCTVTCTTVPVAVERTTWGRLKAMYR